MFVVETRHAASLQEQATNEHFQAPEIERSQRRAKRGVEGQTPESDEKPVLWHVGHYPWGCCEAIEPLRFY